MDLTDDIHILVAWILAGRAEEHVIRMTSIRPRVNPTVSIFIALTSCCKASNESLLDTGINQHRSIVCLPVSLNSSGHELTINLLFSGSCLADWLVLLTHIDSGYRLYNLLKLIGLKSHITDRCNVISLLHQLSLNLNGVSPLISVDKPQSSRPSLSKSFQIVPQCGTML